MEDQLDWFNIVVARREAKKGRGALSKKTPLYTTTHGTSHPQIAAPPTATPTAMPTATPTASADVRDKDGAKGVASQDKHGPKKEAKKKKGLFSNLRSKLKSGGKKEQVKVEGKGEVVSSGAAVGRRGKEGEEEEGEGDEEREERERQEFYKAIGYSEDEEYVEFPRDVSLWNMHTVCLATYMRGA